MSKTATHCLVIALVCGFVFFTNLGATRLWDDDETIYASCAREMLARGDWVVPYYNAQVFFDKPPLVYWSIMAGLGLFGQTEFAARFFSAVLAVATCLLAYFFGRRLFGATSGLWAGIVAASTIVFTISARAATIDMALTFFTTAAMYMFALVALPRLNAETPTGASPIASTSTTVRHPLGNWLLWAAIYCALAVAVLAKGPVGLLLPGCTMALFLLFFRYGSGEDEHTQQQSEAVCARQSLCGAGEVSVSRAEPTEQDRPAWWGRYLLAAWHTLAALRQVFAPRNLLAVFLQMRPITAAVMLAVVALPWYVLVAQRTDGLWLAQFISKYNIGPFLQPSLGHRGPVFYHFVMILVGFFPWSVFLGPVVVFTYRRIRFPDPNRWAYVLLSCWIGVFFLFWSACSTKLPHYVLPTYPALAMLTGSLLADWLAVLGKCGNYAITQALQLARTSTSSIPAQDVPGRQRCLEFDATSQDAAMVSHPLGPRALRRAIITLVLVGVGLLIGVPIVASVFVPGEESVGLVGLTLLLGAAVMGWCIQRAQPERMLTAFAATAVLFVSGIFAWAAVRVDAHQHAAKLVSAARNDCRAEPQLIGYRYLQPSVVYYAARPVPCTDSAEQLRQALLGREHSYIITTQAHAEQLQAEMPGLQVVAARPRFLKRGQLVVLLRPPDRFLPAETAGRIGGAQSSAQR